MRNNKALLILFVTNSIFVFAINMFAPFYAIFVQKMFGGVMLISWSMTVQLLTSTIFLYMVSRAGQGMKNKKYLMATGHLVRAMVWVSFIFVQTPWQLLFLCGLLGLGEAMSSPAFSALFAENLDRNEDMIEYADWMLLANLVAALSVIVGGLVVNYFGFVHLFVSMSVLAVISAMMIFFVPSKILK